MKFFTADLHLDMDHYLGRPFASMEEHDQAVIDGINSTAMRSDDLYILGDLCMSNRWDIYRQQIRCKQLTLIEGNHDRRTFCCEPAKMVKIQDYACWLSHYPHAFWPASHKGSLHLYGHCHAQREETLDLALPERRSMDCGLDNAARLLGAFRPFSEAEVLERLIHQSSHDLPTFYKGSYK